MYVRRAVVKDVGVRPPNDGQATADDARAPTTARRRKTLATPAAVHVRALKSPAPHGCFKG
jgi:hypothetical protein